MSEISRGENFHFKNQISGIKNLKFFLEIFAPEIFLPREISAFLHFYTESLLNPTNSITNPTLFLLLKIYKKS